MDIVPLGDKIVIKMQKPKTTNPIGPVRRDFSTTPATQLNRSAKQQAKQKLDTRHQLLLDNNQHTPANQITRRLPVINNMSYPIHKLLFKPVVQCTKGICRARSKLIMASILFSI